MEDIEVVFKYRAENLKTVEKCVQVLVKKHQLRKYKELYHINLDVLKQIIDGCDQLSGVVMKEEYVLRKPTTMIGGYYACFMDSN